MPPMIMTEPETSIVQYHHLMIFIWLAIALMVLPSLNLLNIMILSPGR
jgi:hypothetical protein